MAAMESSLALAHSETVTQWILTGASDEPDARRAGVMAAKQALGGDDPKLLVVFAASGYDQTALLAGIASVVPDVPVIGCTTAGEIVASGPATGGVVVMALGGSGFSVATAAASSEVEGLRQASATVAESFSRLDPRPYKVLLLLSDGLGGDQQEVVRGAFGVLGAEVPLVGGCAGDDMKMRHTLQFHGSEVLEHAVVGAAIGSEGPIGIGVQHGWRAVGEPMVVTSSEGNSVLTLDDQPALDAYLQRLDAPQSSARTPRHSRCSQRPIRSDSVEGVVTRFASSPAATLARARSTASPPSRKGAWSGSCKAITTRCSARRTSPASRRCRRSRDGRRSAFSPSTASPEKVCSAMPASRPRSSRIREYAPGAPVAGFYTYGEIARTHGVSGFHNQTLVVVAFS